MYAWRGWRFELGIASALVAAFLTLLAIVVAGAPTGVDKWLELRLQSIPWSEPAFIPAFASDLGGGVYGVYVVPFVGAVVLALRRQWRAVVLIAGVFALHYICISPKLFIEAHRPSPLFGVEGAGGLESFPSGHVQWATSLYGFLAYMVARSFPRYRWAILLGYALIIGFTMLSRIELGRHWPIDTVAGLLVGLLAVRVLVALHALPGSAPRPVLEPA
jgi:undecaprenyl-diphosphatase